MFLRSYIENVYVDQVNSYERFAVDRALAAFADPEGEANRVAEEEFRRLGELPGEEDMSNVAEMANDKAIAHYEILVSVKQGLLNLLAAGTFHLFEQQEAAFKLLLQRNGCQRLNIRRLARSYVKLNEARLVANVVKHGESAAEKLRTVRPDLLIEPIAAKTATSKQALSRPVSYPLAGVGLYVSEKDVRDYVAAVRQTWLDVAATL